MKRIHFHFLVIIFLGLWISACTPAAEKADTVLINGRFLTLDDTYPEASVVAIKGGRIAAIGGDELLAIWQGDSTKIIDLAGQFAMPGFIEGHGHFSGFGYGLMNLNFLHAKNWDEIVALVAEKAASTPKGEWISGRGWHQEKWEVAPELAIHGYPSHHTLSAMTKDHPVILRHASGHALFANEAAMRIAGVTAETPDPQGGHIVRDAHGHPIGVFEERAMELITEAYAAWRNRLSPEDLEQEWLKGVQLAQQECLRHGITSFQDAGASFQEIDRYQRLAESGQLNVRLWTMVRQDYTSMKQGLDNRFPIIHAGDHFFTCRAIKTEVDGALGAFGAWLLAPYNDKPDFIGQNTTLVETVDSIAGLALDKGMQLCVHAIGDRANQEVLNLMEKRFQQAGSGDYRWRIEHSQHLDTTDIPRFAQLGVIASMQAIHCTSDAPFVEDRLGYERARTGAYPWRSLLDVGAVVTNGTDVPVEEIDPLASLYASVTRKRPDTGMAFFPEQAMTRMEALHSYTTANAFAAFEEEVKGTLAVGKLADIVVWDTPLHTCTDEELLTAKPLQVFVHGQLQYPQ
ncbi:MAG: amidohydrolase [Saprospiraceae bacterium]